VLNGEPDAGGLRLQPGDILQMRRLIVNGSSVGVVMFCEDISAAKRKRDIATIIFNDTVAR
jgi:hypothetical protein